jgi:hypothetical protein
MEPELIVMLTHHDQTVGNALELFEECKDLPVKHWGFKDVGLPHDQMKAVVKRMKAANKTTYLEVVSLTEEEGRVGAQLAVEAGFDILMGTVYFETIHEDLKDTSVRYYPFPGEVYSHPSILGGTIEGILRHAQKLESKGVRGLDLLGYRYTGNAPKLIREVVKGTHIPIVCAGSIDSTHRIDEVREAGVWGFTIGSAFFEKKFVPYGDFKENILAVADYLAMAGQELKGA